MNHETYTNHIFVTAFFKYPFIYYPSIKECRFFFESQHKTKMKPFYVCQVKQTDHHVFFTL